MAGTNQKNTPISYIRCFSLLVLLCISSNGFTQKKQKVTGIIGNCIVANITPEEARIKAIEEAKKEALITAGVEEHIMVYSSLETTSTNDTTIEYFTSLANTSMSGQIAKWEIISERGFLNDLGSFEYEVVIDAEVIKYKSKPDPNFSADVLGLKPVYYENENLEFSAEISENGFISVFLLSGNAITRLYPNEYESNKKFHGKLSHQFPTDGNIEYKLELGNKAIEMNTLFLVLTKDEASPILDDADSFYSWLYLIEPDEVFYIMYPFNILKK